MDVRHYLTANGADPFQEWLDSLHDLKARVAILRRIDRLMLGNLGDHKFCGEGVWELRVDVGPDTAFITPSRVSTSCFFCAAARSVHKKLISVRPLVTGTTFNRGRYDSQGKIGNAQPRGGYR